MRSRDTFEARYDGRCKICGDQIYSGDPVGYVEDEIACEWCWEDEMES